MHLASINEFVIYLATPCLMVSSLSKYPIKPMLAGEVFLCVAIVVLGCLAIGGFIVRAMGLPESVYLPPIAFANTGNMGLPLLLFAFGDEGLSIGILYMVGTTIMHYTAGIMILSYRENRFEVFKLPLIYAAALGLLVSMMAIKIPAPIGRAIDLLGEASIPTMLFSLGYKLSEIEISDVWISFLFGGLRIGIGFLLGLSAVWMLGMKSTAAGVVLIDAAMPPAVFNFVLAEKYRKDSRKVASIITAGTLLSIATTPLLLALVLRH